MEIPCFVAGTQIVMPTGPRAVESLRRGGLVNTRDGPPMPVLWTGSRSLSHEELMRANRAFVLINFARRPWAIAPRCVCRGSIASGCKTGRRVRWDVLRIWRPVAGVARVSCAGCARCTTPTSCWRATRWFRHKESGSRAFGRASSHCALLALLRVGSCCARCPIWRAYCMPTKR